MSKQVRYVQLKEAFFINGVKGGGQFDKTLPPANKTMPDLTMSLDDNGNCFVEWTEGNYKRSFTIPHSNIKVAEHVPLLVVKNSLVPPVSVVATFTT